MRRAGRTLREEGIVSLTYASGRLLYRDVLLRAKYRVEHGELAPRPGEVTHVDPVKLEYSIASRHIPRDAPPYGILGGSWDLQRTLWRESFWDGLRERFEEGKDWEETVYYRNAVDKLSRRPLKRAEGVESIEEFEQYLDSLDRLYDDIRTNGYSPSSVISASVGRDGEWMVNHGNHRRTVAVLTDTDSVPVRIKYRHERWQDVRRRISRADSAEDLDETYRGYLSHPDARGLLSGTSRSVL